MVDAAGAQFIEGSSGAAGSDPVVGLSGRWYDGAPFPDGAPLPDGAPFPDDVPISDDGPFPGDTPLPGGAS